MNNVKIHISHSNETQIRREDYDETLKSFKAENGKIIYEPDKEKVEMNNEWIGRYKKVIVQGVEVKIKDINEESECLKSKKIKEKKGNIVIKN